MILLPRRSSRIGAQQRPHRRLFQIKATKAPQKAVKYQDSPKGDQRSDNCTRLEAPSSCKTVDGIVSAQRWCIIYSRKPK